MSQWSDRVAPQAAERLAHDARDGATFLSQQIQEMQRTGNPREALELVQKTQFIESRMPQDQYSGHIEFGHQMYNNGWMYENVAVNGQQIASIPERPRDCAPGQAWRPGINVPEIVIGVGVSALIGGLIHRGEERFRPGFQQSNNYYEHPHPPRHFNPLRPLGF